MATELDISNGHAARMRYSRFKQQMEGLSLTTPTVSKVGRPKKATTTVGKSDTANKSSFKHGLTKAGKTLCDKSRGGFERTSGRSFGEQDRIDRGSESSFRRAPVSVDLARQEINVGYGYGRPDHGFAQMPIDPYLLSTSYWKPVPAEPSAFAYVLGAGNPQQQQQQYQHQHQQPQFQADHSSNSYFTHLPSAVAAPPHHGDDATMGGFNSSWPPQTIDAGFNYRSQVTQTLPQTLPRGDSVMPMNTCTPASFIGAAAIGTAVGEAVSAAAAAAVTTAPSPAPEDHEHHENCFSGCCHLPPYPPSPSLTPNFPRPDPRNDPHGDALLAPLSSFPAWTPPPPTLMHWVPIKPEPGEEGCSDDILVKVERAAR